MSSFAPTMLRPSNSHPGVPTSPAKYLPTTLGLDPSTIGPCLVKISAYYRLAERLRSVREHLDNLGLTSKSISCDVGDGLDHSTHCQGRIGVTEAIRNYQGKERCIETRQVQVMTDKLPRCENCGRPIPLGRIILYPEAKKCFSCNRLREISDKEAVLLILQE
jgi:RNA polymerase-binding transcription factor DksA